MYNCKCQQYAEVYFIFLMKTLKNKSALAQIFIIPQTSHSSIYHMSLQHCTEVLSMYWGFQRTVSHVGEGEAYMGDRAAVW